MPPRSRSNRQTVPESERRRQPSRLCKQVRIRLPEVAELEQAIGPPMQPKTQAFMEEYQSPRTPARNRGTSRAWQQEPADLGDYLDYSDGGSEDLTPKPDKSKGLYRRRSYGSRGSSEVTVKPLDFDERFLVRYLRFVWHIICATYDRICGLSFGMKAIFAFLAVIFLVRSNLGLGYFDEGSPDRPSTSTTAEAVVYPTPTPRWEVLHPGSVADSLLDEFAGSLSEAFRAHRSTHLETVVQKLYSNRLKSTISELDFSVRDTNAPEGVKGLAEDYRVEDYFIDSKVFLGLYRTVLDYWPKYGVTRKLRPYPWFTSGTRLRTDIMHVWKKSGVESKQLMRDLMDQTPEHFYTPADVESLEKKGYLAKLGIGEPSSTVPTPDQLKEWGLWKYTCRWQHSQTYYLNAFNQSVRNERASFTELHKHWSEAREKWHALLRRQVPAHAEANQTFYDNWYDSHAQWRRDVEVWCSTTLVGRAKKSPLLSSLVPNMLIPSHILRPEYSSNYRLVHMADYQPLEQRYLALETTAAWLAVADALFAVADETLKALEWALGNIGAQVDLACPRQGEAHGWRQDDRVWRDFMRGRAERNGILLPGESMKSPEHHIQFLLDIWAKAERLAGAWAGWQDEWLRKTLAEPEARRESWLTRGLRLFWHGAEWDDVK